MMPQHCPVAHHCDGGDQLVRAPAQRREMRPRVVAVDRLVEPDAVAVEHLVGADHQGAWVAAGDALRLQLGERLGRSEEHTSELQSLMRNSYAVFCLKKKT